MTLEINSSNAILAERPFIRPIFSSAQVMRGVYLAVVGLVFFFMLTPVLFVFWVSVFDNAVVTFPPRGYSLRWFVNAWENSSFLGGFLTSIKVGMTAMVAGLVLGIPASFALARGNFPG
ncbi:ABC transporter permease, partial [Corallococcus exiguus]|uniref:ABC transporter permease n=1 Tax=Corallococcus exiguus TaxID=83462 RepID=UPI0017F702CF|nr:ABC transporter permease [Corallococcus exiguus]